MQFEKSSQTLNTTDPLGMWKQRMEDHQSKREHYLEKPMSFHKAYPAPGAPMRWPLAIRKVYAALWLGKVNRAIIKAPRGGGKTKVLGTLGFDLWYFKNRNVVDMGGSLTQAQILYRYFTQYCEIDGVEKQIRGKFKISETYSIAGNYFSCIPSSTKQSRGKHPDVLFSDETCETEDDLVKSALPMVDTSHNPLIVMASTFHKIFGIFQDVWDNADVYGYTRFQWDIFDVVQSFSPTIWQKPEYKKIDDLQQLMELAGGRTGDPEGWVSIENVIQAWREKPTLDWFLVEYMGNRPSAFGLVTNPEDVEAATFDSELDTRYNVIKGAERILGIDWGFSSMTSVADMMRHKDDVKVMVGNHNYTQTASEEIIQDVVEIVREGGHRFIYADSSGKFENVALQAALNRAGLRCAVVEVVFSTEKEEMLGNYRAHFERKKIKIPKKFNTAIWQIKRYRYQEGTNKPVKEDDHIPDALMCALHHSTWKVGRYIRPLADQKEDTEQKTITAGLLKQKF